MNIFLELVGFALIVAAASTISGALALLVAGVGLILLANSGEVRWPLRRGDGSE